VTRPLGGLTLGTPPAVAIPWASRPEGDLVAHAWEEGTAPLPPVVLIGSPGIGKTQIASRIFRELAPALGLSLWVTAFHVDALVAAYADAARRLGLASADAPETIRDEDLADRFLRRLSSEPPLSCLVVLDDLSISDELMAPWWPPVNDHVRTLVTTRERWEARRPSGAVVILVPPLNPASSARLLRDAMPAQPSAPGQDVLMRLVAMSQGHPLALQQIAALVRHGVRSPTEVLEEFVNPARRAQSLLMAGRSGEAEQYLRSLIHAQELVVGAHDPSTLTSRANLAAIKAQSGRLQEALLDTIDLLADELRVLGPDHPTTLTTRANLAQLQGQTGDPLSAIAQLRDLLADQLRVLGPDHPTTLTTRANLAQLQGQTGDPLSAIAQLRDLLADQLRVLGPDHPTTLTTRANLAQLQGQTGDPLSAIAQLRDLLADQLRVLGPDHPITLASREELAYWLGRVGDPNGALAVLAQLAGSPRSASVTNLGRTARGGLGDE
jgi:hypothetical protein